VSPDMGDESMGMDPNMMANRPAMQAMMKAFMRRMMGKW